MTTNRAKAASMRTAIPWCRDELPHLTVKQMAEVDRAMVEDLRIDLVRMMENAGRALAHLARVRFLGGDPRAKSVVMLAGAGGNGGGALVCARRLAAWGANVLVFVAGRPGESTVPAHQLEILRRMDLTIEEGARPTGAPRPDLVVDGVIGYSLKGSPAGKAADLIRWANAQDAPVLALDIPSGVDAATGEVRDPAIRASATLTLALPKEGLRVPSAEGYVGELYLADIGVPPSLYSGPAPGLSIGPVFAESDILRLR